MCMCVSGRVIKQDWRSWGKPAEQYREVSSHSSLTSDFPSSSAHLCVSLHSCLSRLFLSTTVPSLPLLFVYSMQGRQIIINLQPSFPVEWCWDGIVCAQHIDICTRRQSRSGMQKRPTVLSNCHARLLTREPDAAGALADHERTGYSNTARVERKGVFMSHHQLSLFFSLTIWSYLIRKTNEFIWKHKVNILGWKQVIGWFISSSVLCFQSRAILLLPSVHS